MCHNLNNSFIFKDSIDIPDDFNSQNSYDYIVEKEIDYFNYSEKFTNEFTGAELNLNYNESPIMEKEPEKVKNNLFIDIDNDNENENENSDDKKNLGRKRAGDKSKGKHTKFSDDNTRRRIKSTVINDLSDFINFKIEDLYGKDIGEGMVRKRLMKLGQNQISNASVKFNQEFMYKTLKNIFSENVTSRITNYSPERNREVVEELINDPNEKRSSYFKGLFNITFLECLKYFRGDDIYIEYLQGFNRFSADEFQKKKGKIIPNILLHILKIMKLFYLIKSREKLEIKKINKKMEFYDKLTYFNYF